MPVCGHGIELSNHCPVCWSERPICHLESCNKKVGIKFVDELGHKFCSSGCRSYHGYRELFKSHADLYAVAEALVAWDRERRQHEPIYAEFVQIVADARKALEKANGQKETI